ncbi:MAG: RAD55 family ATPase [Candidatus Heimdallarchaeaceae archaeon]
MSGKTRIDALVEKVESSLILMTGESGTAKEDLTLKYIEDGITNEDTILVVLFASSATDYIKKLKSGIAGLKTHIDTGRIHFIDSISYRSVPEIKPKNTFFLDHASDLLTLSVTINNLASKTKKLRIVFDQLAILMLYNSPMQVLNFLQTLAARIRLREQSALLLLDSGVIDDQTENTLHTIVDMVVETKREEEAEGVQQLVRIKFAQGNFEPRWVQVL